MSVYAAWRATAADRRRADARRTLGRAIDSGNTLLAWLRENGAGTPEARERYEAWEQAADAAVREADEPQVGRYHGEIQGVTKLPGIVEERLRRLHDIQDRL